MDFHWSEDDLEFAESARQFAEQNLNQDLAKRLAENRFSRESWDSCGDFGLLGLCASTEVGGMGFGPLRTAKIIESFGYGCRDSGLLFSCCAHLFACVMSLEHGASDKVKSDILPGLCAGKLIGANAATEAEAGSDFSSIKTSFVKDGDDYLLSGEKHFITNGPVADEIVVYATSNPAQGFMGIVGFLVNSKTPGLQVGSPTNKTGLTTSPMSSLYFDECRVPGWRRLIRPGGVVFIKSMEWERACLFAAWVGVMQRKLDEAIAYANERKQFGHSIGKNQVIAHSLVDMKLQLESSRLLLYKACWEMENNLNATTSVCLSKLAISEALVKASLFDIQLRGALGISIEGGVERDLRDALASRIYSGTNQMMYEIVAREMGL